MNKPYQQPYLPSSTLQNITDVSVSNLQIGDIITYSNGLYTNSCKLYTDTYNTFITNKGEQSINIGSNLPTCTDATCVNIGNDIGIEGYGTKNVVIGNEAGSYNLGSGCIAIGFQACHSNTTQKDNRIGIGYQAGYLNQGSNSIAIGYKAGMSNQHDNTIVINSTSNELNTEQANSLYIKNIRQVDNGRGYPGMLYVNPTTYEVTYSAT